MRQDAAGDVGNAAGGGQATINILLIVAWPPGGVTDVTGRILAHSLSDQLGQPVVVDNRGGASGTIGHTVASLAAPDGYTLLLGTNSTYAMAPYLFDKLPYDNEKAFTPISLIVSSPQILCANPSFAAQNMPAFPTMSAATSRTK